MAEPQNQGPTVLGVMFSLTVLSTIIVSLRLYCRAKVIQNITLDDYLILFALANAWGIGISNYFQVYYGTGTHRAEITDYRKITAPTLKLWYAYQLQYILVIYCTKASILCFYQRLSSKQLYQWSVYSIGGLTTLYTIVMLFVNIFECPGKVSGAWGPNFPQGCNDLATVYYVMAAFNITTDIAIFLLPLPTALALQVNYRKKTALLLIFSIGSLSVIASIVRIKALVKYQTAVKTGDVAAYILIWTQVEINMAISSASTPSLKPLACSLLGGSTFQNSNAYGQGSSMNSNTRNLAVPETRRGMFSRPGKNGGDIAMGNYNSQITSTIGHGSANTSRENIISVTGGIMRTTDVKVDVETGVRPENGSEDSLRRLKFRT